MTRPTTRAGPRRRRRARAVALDTLSTAVLPPRYTPPPRRRAPSPDAFLAQRVARSRGEGATAGNAERWVRRGGRDAVLLYVHGFVASRAEGELVVERVADRVGADAWFLRLPGHGTTSEDLATRGFSEWVDEAHATLAVLADHYQHVVVVGTSLGGLIATHLAGTRPESVDALVLASPFFGFRRLEARILDWPGGLWLAERLAGRLRAVPLDPSDPEDHRVPGFDAHWYAEYPLAAVREVARARRALARDPVLGRVRAPALLLWYPRDVAADPAAMRAVFGRLGAATRNRGSVLRRSVAIDPGDHVLTSRWVRADHESVEAAVVGFLADVGLGG